MSTISENIGLELWAFFKSYARLRHGVVDHGVLLARMEHYRGGGSGVAGQLPGEEVPVCGL